MNQIQIAFHSDNVTGSNAHPAINCKVHSLPDVDAPETITIPAYDETVKQFWQLAESIAQNHGYSGVFSEGRSGAWAVPYTQHDASGKLVTDWTGQSPEKGYPVYPNVEDSEERAQFLKFRADIENLLANVPTMYADAVAERQFEGKA